MAYKKVKSILLIILSCLMATCMFVALFHMDNAFADRSVTISGSSIFYTSGEAEVWSHQEVFDGDESDNQSLAEYYTMFVFKEGTDAVNYKKHLAYSWKYNAADENLDEDATEASLVAETGWFNMEIGFESYSFKKFIIAFESQQYTQTKDGKTTNYVIFYPHVGDNENIDGVQAVITNDIEQTPDGDEAVLSGHITIKFVEAEADVYGPIQGVYNVEVSDNVNTMSGTFENVGGTYAKYSASSTTPVTPLSFKAEFEEIDEDGDVLDNDYARMILYKLNGQSFRVGTYKPVGFKKDDEGNNTTTPDLDPTDFKTNFHKYYVLSGREYVRNDSDEIKDGEKYFTYDSGVSTSQANLGHFKSGTVNDNAPPVICFLNSVTHVGVGKELPFDYQLIDVLASSPSADTYYYMLTEDQAKNEDSTFKSDNYAEKNLFRLVTDSDNQYMEPHKNHYVPKDNETAVYDDENFKVVAAVKVYLKLYDTRTDSINQTTYVLLDWFVNDNNLVKVASLEGQDNRFIAVATDEIGVTFAYTDGAYKISAPEISADEADTASPEEKAAADKWDRLVKSYQALVTEAAKDIKAGSKNYFYLPSFEDIPDYENEETNLGNLFTDNITAYKDLSFNVYYNNGSNGNTSTQNSNTLSINLTKSGRYMFTIYATDKNSNPMYYYKGGEKKTFTGSNIWSMRESKKDTEYEDTKKYLPWFYFNVEAAEIEIEDPGEREAAFVGTKYASISFDVNAVSFERTYELYRFDNDRYYKDNGHALTYDEFMKIKDELLDENSDRYSPQWFTEIPASSSLTKGSDEYEEFYKYGWNATSPEFVPQDVNTFYVVKLTVTSTVDNLEPKTAYMGISCSAKMRSLKGEDTWLEDNMTSIILLAIAGASLIGIILLLVIKPKDKGDIDEQFEAAKDKKKNK